MFITKKKEKRSNVYSNISAHMEDEGENRVQNNETENQVRESTGMGLNDTIISNGNPTKGDKNNTSLTNSHTNGKILLGNNLEFPNQKNKNENITQNHSRQQGQSKDHKKTEGKDEENNDNHLQTLNHDDRSRYEDEKTANPGEKISREHVNSSLVSSGLPPLGQRNGGSTNGSNSSRSANPSNGNTPIVSPTEQFEKNNNIFPTQKSQTSIRIMHDDVLHHRSSSAALTEFGLSQIDSFSRANSSNKISRGSTLPPLANQGGYNMQIDSKICESGESNEVDGVVHDIIGNHNAQPVSRGVAGQKSSAGGTGINLDDDDGKSLSGFSSFGELEKLKDYQATLDMICEAALDTVIIIDEAGRIKCVNRETLQMFGYDLWEIAGKNVKMLMPREYALRHDKYLERYRLTKMKRIIGQVRTNISGVTKNGTRVSLKLKVQAITDMHGTVYIGVLKDVGRDEELYRIRDMLSHMLPKGYEEKISMGKMIAEQFRNGSVMFVDLVNFTNYSSTVEPSEIIRMLNQIFEQFDHICKPLEVEKIKTIGDCYMCAAGVTRVMYDSPIRVIEAALQMLDVMKKIGELDVRIGIASGKVVSGVLKGDKLTFDIWGDTVNVASRMEKHAPVNSIRVCVNTYKQTKFMYQYHPVEELEVKGKGVMKTYVYKERKSL